MFSRRISVLAPLLLIGLIWSGAALQAQSTGSISGTVSDESGAIIPGGTVTITNKATGAARSLTTNAQGLYNAPALEAGQYEMRVELQGFRTLVRDAEVFAGTDSTVNLAMQLGESKEVVNVEASAAQLNYENHSIAGVVERNTVQDIPLNGRSFFQLGSLEPGVSIQTSALGARNGPVKISILGGSSGTGGLGGGSLGSGGGATYLALDGLSIMDALELDPAMTFSQEMVQEFQISTVNFPVGPSVTSVGAVNVVSRSGSNDFHGSGFFFYRDHNLSSYPGLARIPFALNPYFVRKDPGFWVGGPIVKNKAFFFYDWEPQKQVQAVAFQPDIAALSPLTAVFSSPNINRSMNVRLDYRLSDSQTAFLRYTHDGNKNFGVPGGSPVEPSDWNHLNNWSDAYAFGLTSTLSPTIVSDFRLGWRMWNNAESPVIGSPGDVMEAVNSPDCQLPCIGAGLPQMSMIGSSAFAAGQSSGTAKQNRLERHYEPQWTISWQKGSHSLKFGFDLDFTSNIFLYDYAQLGAVQLYSPANAISALGPNASSILPNLPQTITTTEDLENLPVRFGANAFAAGNPIIPGPYHFESERRDIRSKIFASDTWKVKSSLTVNYGLAYTYESGVVPSDVPLPSYMAPLFGLPVGSSVGAPQNYKGEFGPVIGFAWSLGTKTVIRGGAGEYFDTVSQWVKWKDLAAVGPLGNGHLSIDVSSYTNIFPGVLVQGAGGLVPLPIGASIQPNVFSTLTLGQFMQIYNQEQPAINAFFNPVPQTTGTFKYAAINYAKNGSSLYGPSPLYQVPRSYQTSIGVQRDLGHDMVFTADWARRLGVHTSMNGIDLNHYSEVINGVQSPVIPKCPVSPDLNPEDNCSLGAFSFNWDEGRTVYEGLLLKLQKRMSHRYQFIASYALQSLKAPQVVDLNNWFAAYGDAISRQNFNLAGVVDLPWGFQVSLNNSYISKTPSMAVTTGIDLSGTGATASSPLPGLPYNCLGVSCGKGQLQAAVAAFNAKYAGTKAPNGATIPAYVLPPNYDLGDNTVYQDVRLTKTFSFKERYQLAIMGEFFNLFNIANLTGYGFNLNPLAKGCQLTAPGSAFTNCATQSYGFGTPTNRAQQTFLSGGPRAEQVGLRFTF